MPAAPEAARVLVVDDHDAPRDRVIESLRLDGIDVVGARSGEAALDLLRSQTIGLAVVDMDMPVTPGTDLVHTIGTVSDSASPPVVLMMGSGDEESIVAGLRSGADDFVQKPVRLRELGARVKAHLRRQAAWSHVVMDELRLRAEVVAALGRLVIPADPEEAAAAVVRELAKRTASAFVSVLQVDANGGLHELATYSRIAGVQRGGHVLGTALAQRLMAHALVGPWADEVKELEARLATTAFAAADADLAAGAPIYSGIDLVGILTIGETIDSDMSPVVQRSNLLAAAIDYSNVLSTRVGRALAGRQEVATTRARLIRVLEAAEFSPVFQPIVELATRRVVGFEALTRFQDGTPPDAQFTEAHSIGLGQRFELATLRAAMEQGPRLPADAFLSVNVSPDLVLHASDLLRPLIEGSDRQIVLELTEYDRIEDYPLVREALAALGNIEVAVDDAGAGYASLRHILELRPAFAKLDMALVRNIDGDEVRQALAAGMQFFASRIGSRLIAEGVETEAEVSALLLIGIELAQGYLFGRPGAVAGAVPPDRSSPTAFEPSSSAGVV